MLKTRLERQAKLIEDTLAKMSGEARKLRAEALALNHAPAPLSKAYQDAAKRFNAVADQELGRQAYLVKLAVSGPGGDIAGGR